jgi:hypothetical protein
MAKTGKVLKYVGVAVLIYAVATAVSSKLANNIKYGFQSLRFVDFWQNIAKLRIMMETVLTIENNNTVIIEITQFDGHLVHKDEKLVRLTQTIPVIIKPKTRQPIRFTFKADLLEAAAKLYLAMSDNKTRIVGTRIVGNLYLVVDGVPFMYPYNEVVAIDL